MPDRRGRAFAQLVELMARLRGPGGCPWDREQTHLSLRPYLLEEAYETLEAIEDGAPGRLREELGDLLLQVVFHAQIASEHGRFTIEDVVGGLAEKLIRRHPHVFGGARAASPDAVLARWDRIKEEERAQAHAGPDAGGAAAEAGAAGQPGGALSGLPRTLPALALAQQMQTRAAERGVAWPDLAGAIRAVRERLDELERAAVASPPQAVEAALGGLLFAAAALPRYLGQNAELALRAACARFRERFDRMEARARASGQSLREYTADELLALWREAR